MPGQKVLLMVDGHKSHETIEAIEFCIEKAIELYELPPHMTHCLQPLDVGFFGPLKTNWNVAQEEYVQTEEAEGKFVSKEEFAPVLKIAWDNTLAGKDGTQETPDNSQSSQQDRGVVGVRNSFA